jgi:hypothetical protein
MSDERSAFSNDVHVTPEPHERRLLYFADLRPDYVESFRDDAGVERTLAALAILQFRSVEWELDIDQEAALVEHLTAVSQGGEWGEKHPNLGEGTPILAYCVVELDADGQEIDDWYPGDLEACKSFLDRYGKTVSWERLPTDGDAAASHVSRCLSRPPNRS